MFVPTDLHGHTLFSDGKSSPEEFVDFRRIQNMRVIAVTDHDLMAAIPRAASAAQRAQMVLLPGLEVTSFLHFGTERAEQFHVLAYFPPSYWIPPKLESTALFRRGQRVQAKWKAFFLEWLSKLPQEDRALLDPEQSLEKLSDNDFPALQSTLTMLVEKKLPLYVAFQKHHLHFWDDAELFAWKPEEAIDFIRADGATDFVAHAVRYRDTERTEQVIQYAQGIEVYTSRHKPEVAEHFRSKALTLGKLWTASSDDHQNAKYARPPSGTPVTTLEHIVQGEVPVQQLYAMSDTGKIAAAG